MSCHYLSKFISSVNQSCKKNAIYTVIDYSILNLELTKVLFRNGFLTHYTIVTTETKESKKFISIYFKQTELINPIKSMKQISKPGRRIYITNNNIFQQFGKYHLCLVSTSMGVYTLNELRQIGVGGELLIDIEC